MNPPPIDHIPSDPPPLLLVLRVPGKVSEPAVQSLRSSFSRLRDLNPHLPPLVILQDGMELTAVVDPRGDDK